MASSDDTWGSLTVLAAGHGKSKRFVLSKQEITIGRKKTCDICLNNHSISFTHVKLIRGSDDQVLVCSLGKKPVSVSGRPVVGSRKLVPGEVLEIALGSRKVKRLRFDVARAKVSPATVAQAGDVTVPGPGLTQQADLARSATHNISQTPAAVKSAPVVEVASKETGDASAGNFFDSQAVAPHSRQPSVQEVSPQSLDTEYKLIVTNSPPSSTAQLDKGSAQRQAEHLSSPASVVSAGASPEIDAEDIVYELDFAGEEVGAHCTSDASGDGGTIPPVVLKPILEIGPEEDQDNNCSVTTDSQEDSSITDGAAKAMAQVPEGDLRAAAELRGSQEWSIAATWHTPQQSLSHTPMPHDQASWWHVLNPFSRCLTRPKMKSEEVPGAPADLPDLMAQGWYGGI